MPFDSFLSREEEVDQPNCLKRKIKRVESGRECQKKDGVYLFLILILSGVMCVACFSALISTWTRKGARDACITFGLEDTLETNLPAM